MLSDYLEALDRADMERMKEKLYKELEKLGMDRRTADMLVAEMRKEKKDG